MKTRRDRIREDDLLQKMTASARLARDLVYPRRCPVCDRPVQPWGALICPCCEEMLQKVEGPVCRRCGKQLRSGSGSLCRDCRTLPHIFARGMTVFTYHSAAGGIFRFKYRGRQEYGAYYGSCMANKLMACAGIDGVYGSGGESGINRRYGTYRTAPTDPIGMPDLLVPVPISAHRLQKRGYNQALILAREISRRTRIPVCEGALRRVTDTLPMKNMTPAERQNNLKKAFQAFGNDVELNSIMLIDDIYTTGATIDACANALYRQGARRVCFITLAAGEDSGF